MICKGDKVRIKGSKFVHIITDVRKKKKGGLTYHAHKERFILAGRKDYLKQHGEYKQQAVDKHGIFLTAEDITVL